MPWLATLGFVASLIGPYSSGRSPIMLLTAFYVASFVASRWLGRAYFFGRIPQIPLGVPVRASWLPSKGLAAGSADGLDFADGDHPRRVGDDVRQGLITTSRGNGTTTRNIPRNLEIDRVLLQR